MSFSETRAFGDGGGCGLSVLGSAIVTAIVTAVFLTTEGIGIAAIGFAVAFVVSLTVIGLAAAVIGLPLTQILLSNGWERPWSYPLAGFIFGGAIVLIFLEMAEPPTWSVEVLAFLLIGALPGALCGALWWWFERRHRQDDTGRGS